MKFNLIDYKVQGAPTIEADKGCFYVQITIIPEGIEIKEVKDEITGAISYEIKFPQVDFVVLKLPDTLTAKELQKELKLAVIDYVKTTYGELVLESVIK